MEYNIEVFGCFCALSLFVIKGIEADYEDFEEKYDRDSYNAEVYACGNMQFTRVETTEEVLVKDNINKEEYNIIASELEEKLSFGACGWCV